MAKWLKAGRLALDPTKGNGPCSKMVQTRMPGTSGSVSFGGRVLFCIAYESVVSIMNQGLVGFRTDFCDTKGILFQVIPSVMGMVYFGSTGGFFMDLSEAELARSKVSQDSWTIHRTENPHRG